MPDLHLKNCRILVAEDEYMLAEDLCADLRDTGAVTIGPAGTVDEALLLARSEPRIDGAILDINLRGQMIFPAVDLLLARQVPVILTTGYDSATIPTAYQHIARCEKPVSMEKVLALLSGLIAAD